MSAPASQPASQPVRPTARPGGAGSPRPGRRSRENTRARLLEAAATVVIEKGIGGVRIEDVVGTAGLTRGAFYSNYTSVEQVVIEAVVAHCTTLVHQVSEAVASIEGPPSTDTLVEVLEAIRPTGRSTYILLTEYRLYRMRHPEAEELPEARHEELFSVLSGTVEDLLARMGRRALLPPQTLVDILAAAFLDSVALENEHAIWHGSERDPRLVLHQVVEAVILGLSTPEDPGQAPAPSTDTPPLTP